MPLFVIGIKDKIPNKSEDMVKKHIAIEILLNMIIGKSSGLYKRMYEEKLLISEPYLEYEFTDQYAHVAITGTSKNPDEILNQFQKEVEILKKEKINKSHFERIRNMLYGNAVKEFNNVSDISRMFISDYFKEVNSFDYLEKYKQVTPEYIYEVLKEVFNKEKTVLSVIKGNK